MLNKLLNLCLYCFNQTILPLKACFRNIISFERSLKCFNRLEVEIFNLAKNETVYVITESKRHEKSRHAPAFKCFPNKLFCSLFYSSTKLCTFIFPIKLHTILLKLVATLNKLFSCRT